MGQGLHCAAPANAAKRPVGQGAHRLRPSALACCPAAQASHAVAPEVSEWRPAAQAAQAEPLRWEPGVQEKRVGPGVGGRGRVLEVGVAERGLPGSRVGRLVGSDTKGRSGNLTGLAVGADGRGVGCTVGAAVVTHAVPAVVTLLVPAAHPWQVARPESFV
jgi:hypothetical protein